MDLNHRSPPYKGGALTTKLYAPMFRDRDSKHQFCISFSNSSFSIVSFSMRRWAISFNFER